MDRAQDWLDQAERDLDHARSSQHAEWACFAAHQAAEKAIKALVLSLGGVGWGHSVLKLVESLPAEVELPDGLLAAARRLDRHYIPTRYPNGFDQGKPGDYYTAEDAAGAIADAERALEFSRGRLP